MKDLLAIIAIFASGLCFGQSGHTLPSVDGKINFNEVVFVDGASKDDLYSRAKLWFADAFKSSNYVIQLDDRENGVILGKGTLRIEEPGSMTRPTVVKTWGFTIKVQVREGRYKAELYGIDYRFEQPEHSHRPGMAANTYNLDALFADRKMYGRNGELRDGAPENIARWTKRSFTGILASINGAMTVEATVDDF
jgi:hypothetical protein